MDAFRLVALLGVVLWLIPVTWPNATAPGVEAMTMSHALFYVFGVWILLIALSSVLALLLGDKRATIIKPDDEA